MSYRQEKAIVASGHKLVSRAAAEILKIGGNAFDAVVGAGFASAVVEPALTSLGGGGFMIGHDSKNNKNIFYDFFVDTPGKGTRVKESESHFFPITVNFSGSQQDFNVGLGSIAVPGTLKGLLHIHKSKGKIPLKDVLAPAIEYAKEHTLNSQQHHFLKLLFPIMTLAKDGNELYNKKNRFVQEGSKINNPKLVNFLHLLVDCGDEEFYRGEIASKIEQEMKESGGLLTKKDLEEYRVIERPPFSITYDKYQLVTAPEPSIGGSLIGLSLSLSQNNINNSKYDWGSSEHLIDTTMLMKEVEKLRIDGVTSPSDVTHYLDNEFPVKQKNKEQRLFSRGTTHISISDSAGNCASMTCSNGEGSGYFAPETGVMLNNMMGEDDLHPNGFHSSPPGQRVCSMMSPSLLIKGNEVKLVLGSGGSKRIRTAISQVITQVVGFGRSLEQAVQAPRLYWDGDVLQVEPGFDREAIEKLKEIVTVNEWTQQDVYFGGVHGVVPGVVGAGDARRGGSVLEVEF